MNQQIRDEIHRLMEDYKNRPSNANKAYQSMQALVDAYAREFAIGELEKVRARCYTGMEDPYNEQLAMVRPHEIDQAIERLKGGCSD